MIHTETEPPMDITTEMMSPATTALLANMNAPIASAAGSCSTRNANNVNANNNNNNNNASMNGNHDQVVGNDNGDTSNSGRNSAFQRRPLEAIRNNDNDGTNTNNNSNNAESKRNDSSKTKNSNSGSRVMGPNEITYRQNYDPFVTKAITRYSARMQTNLRRNCTLPNYISMNSEERKAALQGVDALLERLSSGSGVVTVANANANGHGSVARGKISNNETFGSATTLEEEQNNDNYDNDTTLGSATTLGGGQQHDETFGSATTMGEGTNEKSKRQSTDSATTLGNNDKSFAEQSVSLLEESMALLSEDDDEDDDDDDDGLGINDNDKYHQRRHQLSPGAGPIERPRHSQHIPHPPNTSLALMDESATPPFSTYKRCASNSGKRGLKSRHKSSINENVDDDDEDSFGHFNGIGSGDSGGGGGGLCFNDQDDDVFSCGSPIQQRFSMDGLESDYEEEMRDGLRDLPDNNIGDEGMKRKGDNMNGHESEGSDSRFSYQDDENENVSFGGGNADYYNDDYFEDNGDVDHGRNITESQRPGTQPNQLSQWNTFRNADAQLTSTQMIDGDDSEKEESPVRRRAIRFESQSLTRSSKLRSQRKIQRSDGNTSRAEQDVNATNNNVVDEQSKRNNKQKSSKKKSNHNADDEDDDPIQTVRNLCRRAKSLEDQGVDSSLLEEVAPINVRLRDGMHFRMDPLRCRQDKEKKNGKGGSFKSNKTGNKSTKKKSVSMSRSKDSSDSEDSLSDPEPSFKDPISDFPTRVAARLNAGLNFLTEKEKNRQPMGTSDEHDGDSSSAAVLLSMTIHQIVCVTSKLLVQTRKPSRLHQHSKNKPSSARRRHTPSANAPPPKKDGDYLAGGTLIVLRGKEDISQWEVALREYTSLSCINHAEMQSSVRKLVSTAGKCAGFDVVLTTYDAIKSKEVTVPLDATGCAILGAKAKSNNDDGWYSSRGNTQSEGTEAPQKCHQLSVLHRMSWFRVIFMDVLGRKGFLTKPGTARAQAAVAINSLSRFALFEKEDTTTKTEEKFKDDRRQLRSIITALHLPERMKLDKLIGTYILDVNHVAKKGSKANDKLDSSSSSSGSDDDEYISDDGNLTDPW